MTHDNRYVWLDLIRGVSALLVCGGHLRAALFVDYYQLEHAGIIDKLFYFSTSLGHQAVMVFFVLSGFFVGGSVLNRKNNFKFSNYLIARLFRLWVVLIPALIFTALIDIYLYSNHSQLLIGNYHSTISSGPDGDYSYSLETFIANIFFIQNIYFPVFGTNGPLWSLANEFWYYMIFPFIVIVLGYLPSTSTKRLVSMLLILVITLLFIQAIWKGLIIWLLGVGVFIIYKKTASRSNFVFVFITGCIFFVVLLGSKVWGKLPVSDDILVAVSFSLFVISLKDITPPKVIFNIIACIAKWLSEISYSLYLFHFPVVLLIYVNFYKKGQISLNLSGFTQYAIWLILLVLGGFMFWWVFERNTLKIKKRVLVIFYKL